MFDFYLPLEKYFVKILLENKIQYWEAKLFWLNIQHFDQLDDKGLRQQMYNALRVLTSNGFLSAEYSRYDQRIFLYSETLKLHEFRKKVLKSNYKDIIQNEEKIINDEIEQFELQKKFIDELYLKYPELAPQYFKLKEKIILSQNYSNIKLKTIISLRGII